MAGNAQCPSDWRNVSEQHHPVRLRLPPLRRRGILVGVPEGRGGFNFPPSFPSPGGVPEGRGGGWGIAVIFIMPIPGEGSGMAATEPDSSIC